MWFSTPAEVFLITSILLVPPAVTVPGTTGCEPGGRHGRRGCVCCPREPLGDKQRAQQAQWAVQPADPRSPPSGQKDLCSPRAWKSRLFGTPLQR